MNNQSIGNAQIEQFLIERRAALLSMDKIAIWDYARKWGVKLPQDEQVFWIGVHMARTGAKDLPIEERRKSKIWLSERGYSSLDDNDI